MIAIFIRPGAYLVRYGRETLTVLASNPCVALVIAGRHWKIGQETEPMPEVA